LKPKPYKEAPETLGEHLRKRRMELGLLQRQVALQLGVSPFTYLTWEKDQLEPEVRMVPRIIGHLGYDPFPEPKTLGERIKAKRRRFGLSQEQAAKHLSIDEGTLRRWERDEWRPSVRTRVKLEIFLAQHEPRLLTDWSLDSSAPQNPVRGLPDTCP